MCAWSPLSFMGKDVAVDMGSSRTQVYVRRRGVVLDEPSVIARAPDSGRVVATGTEALEAENPQWPLTRGGVDDIDGTMRLLASFLRRAHGRPFAHPRLVLGVPSYMSHIQISALQQIAYDVGARSVRLVDQALAAALGAGLPVTAPHGSMVLDIRSDAAEVAIIARGEVLAVGAVALGLTDFDQAIVDGVRQEHDLIITLEQAAGLRHRIGTAFQPGNRSVRITGRKPKDPDLWSVLVSAREVHAALDRPLRFVIVAVHRLFEQVSPDLVADVITRGMVLTGCGSLLRGLVKRMIAEFRVPVRLAHEPRHSVVLGLGHYAETFGWLNGADVPELDEERVLLAVGFQPNLA